MQPAAVTAGSEAGSTASSIVPHVEPTKRSVSVAQWHPLPLALYVFGCVTLGSASCARHKAQVIFSPSQKYLSEQSFRSATKYKMSRRLAP